MLGSGVIADVDDAGAYALLRAGDYAASTIDGVARSAGMARRTVYTLVASKEELIAGVIEREGALLEGLLPGAGSGRAALLAELRAFMAVWAQLALGPMELGMYVIAPAHRDSADLVDAAAHLFIRCDGGTQR